MTEFEKYAMRHMGISSMSLHRYQSLYGSTQSSITPYIIEERKLNVAQMDVFSRLMMDRILFLGVPIVDEVANILQAQLLFLDSTDPGKDIQLYINSPGGSVTAGLGIYDTMQLIRPQVGTICTGQAASMAAVLLASGAKGKRSALPHARMMIHQPVGGVEGQAADMAIAVKEILELQEQLYQILAEHTGKPLEQIRKDADRDFWMRSADAVTYGIVDEVLKKTKK
ncbi:MAG: ATP-dependent Clp protease proteolytic subunit [Bacteroidales bacterium]|jgi:ATP-dependent Clp protease protease subunit|nr:ATP-dependent Clp protease proteolytic subunit [Bacteroidales bacterium]NLK79898.1 ATP-dependent Clp protease proteolytic subunit [Bacteroidales bacterium]HKM30613.1 ATP-dependent Clp protease proteolytic subunit [Bacteroidales bacterium]